MDVIAAYRAGHVNAVASMGTALTSEHVNRLRKLTKKIVLTYDGDKPGQNAIAKSLELLSDFQVDIVKIPDSMDLMNIYRKHPKRPWVNSWLSPAFQMWNFGLDSSSLLM